MPLPKRTTIEYLSEYQIDYNRQEEEWSEKKDESIFQVGKGLTFYTSGRLKVESLKFWRDNELQGKSAFISRGDSIYYSPAKKTIIDGVSFWVFQSEEENANGWNYYFAIPSNWSQNQQKLIVETRVGHSWQTYIYRYKHGLTKK